MIHFPGKMPFEERVIEYLRLPVNGAKVSDCARTLGISESAVMAVLASLEQRGLTRRRAPRKFSRGHGVTKPLGQSGKADKKQRHGRRTK